MLAVVRVILVLSLLTFASPAFAIFMTCSKWLSISPSDRIAYVAGVYDSLVTFAESADSAKAGMHYQNCIARSKMSPQQMSENIRAFVLPKAELHARPMPAAVLDYLLVVCGKPA
jgi:hypothetical protein